MEKATLVYISLWCLSEFTEDVYFPGLVKIKKFDFNITN